MGLRHEPPPLAADGSYRTGVPAGGARYQAEALGNHLLPEGLFMPQTNRLPTAAPPSATRPALNPAQQRSVLFALLDLHRRMADLEALLAQAQTPSPFSQFVNDLSPTEAQVTRDYFTRVRSRMQAWLEEAGLPLDIRRTGLRWGLQCGATAMHIAVAEAAPERLHGYGPLDDRSAATVAHLQQDLTRLIDRFEAYLRQGLGRDLGGRLARLEGADAGVEVLAALERVITRRGLVELRPLLDQLVRRMEEAPRFEVAVFGRVSSGKSSLLNHVAGLDVLPVGVTPVTAVPTRLVRGDRLAAVVSFAEGAPRTVAVEELRQYASEEGNPGNRKHVTDILVQAPSPRLREGVVLVDTPGVGSLARAGSAEALAYLPRCDLGVVLIDAASTLTPDDLGLIRLLYEAAVPAQVLLSKADLLTPQDRERTVAYVREQLRHELGLALPAHPVSVVGADEALLTRWFEQEIEPLLARHRALAEASVRRKINHLRESAIAALETLLARQRGAGAGQAPTEGAAVRRLLDGADKAVREAQARCRDWGRDRPALVELALADAAHAVVVGGRGQAATLAAVERVLLQRGEMAHATATGLREELARALDGLRQAAPWAPLDPAPIRDLALRGLPAPDLSALRPRLSAGRPWWAPLLPRLARWAVRGALERRLGLELRERLEQHDRQVQAWLKACLGQLVEGFEAQAEPCREQARRLAAGGDGAPDAREAQGLEADLLELRGAGHEVDGSPR